MNDPEDLEKKKLADAMMSQARQLVDVGRFAEALPIAQRVHEQLPKRGDALVMLGVLYSRLGDPLKALEMLAEALLVEQGNPRILYYLAEVYLQTGSPVHAMRSLRRLNDRWAGDQALRDLPDPRPLIERLDASMISELGLAGLTREHQEVAMMAAERGRLRLLFQGDTRRAAAEFRMAIRFAPQYPQARNNLSLTYFLDGHADQALETVMGVLQLHPDNVFALATLAYYRYALGADPQESLPLAQRAAGLIGPEPRLPDLIKVAEVLSLLGDDAGCERLLRAAPPPERLLASAADGGEIARLTLLAAAVANQGRTEEAADGLRDASLTFHDRFASRLLDAVSAREPAYGGRYPGVSWDALLSPLALARLTRPPGKRGARLLRGEGRSLAPRDLPATLLRQFPRLTEACAILLWLGEKTQEDLAITLLGVVDTPSAVELLRAHLSGTLGSYAGRHDAGYALLDNGHLENGAVTRFWMGTDWGEVQIFRLNPRRPELAALGARLYELVERINNANRGKL